MAGQTGENRQNRRKVLLKGSREGYNDNQRLHFLQI
jgi:hypothetical protein